MLAATLTAALLAPLAPAEAAEQWHGVLGRSERGRPIRVHRFGDFSSPTEDPRRRAASTATSARASTSRRRLARGPLPAGIDLWVVHNLNPDGRRLGIRLNGRGVDLNRNFGSEWMPIGSRWDPQYSGPRPWSERETRLARRLVRRVRPDVTIWYHQPQAVVRAWGGSTRDGPPLRAPRRGALPLHPLAARNGAELAEPRVPRRRVLRRRASRRAACATAPRPRGTPERSELLLARG